MKPNIPTTMKLSIYIYSKGFNGYLQKSITGFGLRIKEDFTYILLQTRRKITFSMYFKVLAPIFQIN
jgi:hypothetical protein